MMNNKTAPSTVHSFLAERWSPRSFTDVPVTEEQVSALLEALRWSPSCFNDQPWRLILGLNSRDDGHHAAIIDLLADGNRIWAPRAPLLLIACAHTRFDHNGEHNRWAQYDTGAAMLSLTLQALTMGLYVHQMGGFDAEATRRVFSLPSHVVPMAAAAVGHRGEDVSHLPDWAAESELGPRARKPVEDLLIP